jgi:hypothetical protein
MPSNLPTNGVSVRTYAPPPASIDFSKCSDKRRAVYGVPPRSRAFRAVEKRWLARARKLRIVRATFETRERKRKRSPELGAAHRSQNTKTWSGGVVYPPRGGRIRWVEGSWTVPQVSAPARAKTKIWYTASCWVGIDGDGSSCDVLQAGCDCDVRVSKRGSQQQCNLWWEWFPAGSSWIRSIKISPGDVMACLICVPGESDISASIFLANLTKRVGCIFSVTAPEGILLHGNCAEWIVEALDTNDGKPALANYTPVVFSHCNAGVIRGTAAKTKSVGSGKCINIVNSRGKIVSKGKKITRTKLRVSYV